MAETKKERWYREVKEYWDESLFKCADMVQSHYTTSRIDIKETFVFLSELYDSNPFSNNDDNTADEKIEFKLRKDCVLDAGSGTGRLTRKFNKYFQTIDVLDQSSKYVKTAWNSIGDEFRGLCFEGDIQDFVPIKDRYGLIWVQYVLGHLYDEEDLLRFLFNFRNGLSQDSLMVIKEKCSYEGYYCLKKHCYIFRPAFYYKGLFLRAGFAMYKEQIYNTREHVVRTFALKKVSLF